MSKGDFSYFSSQGACRALEESTAKTSRLACLLVLTTRVLEQSLLWR